MTITYSDPYKDNKFGKLKGDKRDTYFKVVFEEAKFYKHEDSYVLAGFFTLFSGVEKAYGGGAIDPVLCELPIYGKEYEIRRKAWVNIPTNDPQFPNGVAKEVEANTIMVWDDIDPSVFLSKGDIYRLFKFGYDKSSDKIEVSSEVTGENPVFHCFCPKVFSSINPLHLHDQLKELRRRLIVIPTKRVEDLSEKRLQELNINDGLWSKQLIDISNLNWKGFNELFKRFWDLDLAEQYLANRKLLVSYVKGLSSQERAISIELVTTGVTVGIWNDEDEAIADVKQYWKWFKGEVKIGEAPLSQLLKQLVKEEEKNAKNTRAKLSISNQQVKANCQMWYEQGQLLEKPVLKMISFVMNELGYRLIVGGKWVKS